ncbi:hypothetical protein [Rhodopila sp.]|uniref:hypothetical protein n=1 Tax=Rhodopila sp. TaxID=2480087 RepID=UPI003D1072CC
MNAVLKPRATAIPRSVILDASAVLAFLLAETGKDMVLDALLSGADCGSNCPSRRFPSMRTLRFAQPSWRT